MTEMFFVTCNGSYDNCINNCGRCDYAVYSDDHKDGLLYRLLKAKYGTDEEIIKYLRED